MSVRIHPRALLFTVAISIIACNANRDEWQPLGNMPDTFRRNVIGDPGQAGPFKFQLKVPAGARIEAHKHDIDVRVKVIRGSMYIIIGEPLDLARVQHFVAGGSFMIPAETWHVEWWYQESVMEVEGSGPMGSVLK